MKRCFVKLFQGGQFLDIVKYYLLYYQILDSPNTILKYYNIKIVVLKTEKGQEEWSPFFFTENNYAFKNVFCFLMTIFNDYYRTASIHKCFFTAKEYLYLLENII